MSDKTTTNSYGIGFTGLLTIVFITLKLLGKITWSWVWVLSPTWIPFSILTVIATIALIFALEDEAFHFDINANRKGYYIAYRIARALCAGRQVELNGEIYSKAKFLAQVAAQRNPTNAIQGATLQEIAPYNPPLKGDNRGMFPEVVQ